MPAHCSVCQSVFDSGVHRCPNDGSALVQSRHDPWVGAELGDYRVEALLGVGSVGSVYRAVQRSTGRGVALKLLRPEVAAERKSARRFQREAEAVRLMAHPNVVRVIDSGVVDQVPFLAMELLRGPTLQAVLRDQGPLPPARAVTIAEQIALGLGEAHRRGLVHRDLKPGNVILVDEGGFTRVKVLDFGLVGFVDEAASTRLTREGFLLGTPAYMAPEQVGDARQVGPAADLYALGVVLYEMLSGRPPFTGSLRDVVLAQIRETPPRLEGFGRLGELVHALLDKAPERRPAGADEVAMSLGGLAAVLDAREVSSSDDASSTHAVPALGRRTRVMRRSEVDAFGDAGEGLPLLPTDHGFEDDPVVTVSELAPIDRGGEWDFAPQTELIGRRVQTAGPPTGVPEAPTPIGPSPVPVDEATTLGGQPPPSEAPHPGASGEDQTLLAGLDDPAHPGAFGVGPAGTLLLGGARTEHVPPRRAETRGATFGPEDRRQRVAILIAAIVALIAGVAVVVAARRLRAPPPATPRPVPAETR